MLRAPHADGSGNETKAGDRPRLLQQSQKAGHAGLLTQEAVPSTRVRPPGPVEPNKG